MKYFQSFNSFLIEAFDGIADLTKALHFETDSKKAEDMKIEIGKRQGEVTRRKQIEGGEYSLRRFRKEIKYGDGKDLGVFLPGSYDAATSSLGDGPHAKKAPKVKWNQRKYAKWLEDVASNDGWKNAFDMAQNARYEPGLLDWAKKQFRGEDPLQRIQWDIEAFAESVVTEAKGFKNTKDFEAWLEEIEGMPERQLRKIMGKDYIDTPGFWAEEKDDYENIIDFMISNMGNFDELEDYWENNVAESVVNESEAENILNDLLDERGGDMGELHGMSMEDALDTVETYGHKGSKAKKIAKELVSMCNESVVNEGVLSNVRKAIAKTQGALKKKWAKKGGYENFGQDEIRDLQDKYGYNGMVYGTPEERKAAKLIDALDQWAMNYVGESEVTNESLNEKKHVAPETYDIEKNWEKEGSRFRHIPFAEYKSRQAGKPDFKTGKMEDIEVEQWFTRIAGQCDGRLHAKILKGFDKYGKDFKQAGDNMETYKNWIIQAMIRCGFMVEGEITNEANTLTDKWEREEAEFKRIIDSSDKRVYDLVDYVQFSTGGMTEKDWEKFMYGRYKKNLQSTDSKTKEKMYKVLQKMVLESEMISESATEMLAKEIQDAEYHIAHGDGSTIEARSTKKTWDDGVPVLKYIARGKKQMVKMPKGSFELVVDEKYGWYYWENKGTWYGANIEYGATPPFEF